MYYNNKKNNKRNTNYLKAEEKPEEEIKPVEKTELSRVCYEPPAKTPPLIIPDVPINDDEKPEPILKSDEILFTQQSQQKPNKPQANQSKDDK